jgi:hypothetical protein
LYRFSRGSLVDRVHDKRRWSKRECIGYALDTALPHAEVVHDQTHRCEAGERGECAHREWRRRGAASHSRVRSFTAHTFERERISDCSHCYASPLPRRWRIRVSAAYHSRATMRHSAPTKRSVPLACDHMASRVRTDSSEHSTCLTSISRRLIVAIDARHANSASHAHSLYCADEERGGQRSAEREYIMSAPTESSAIRGVPVGVYCDTTSTSHASDTQYALDTHASAPRQCTDAQHQSRYTEQQRCE